MQVPDPARHPSCPSSARSVCARSWRRSPAGIVITGAFADLPLGVLFAGYLVEWLGIRITIPGVAGDYLLVTLSLLVNPTIREMRTAVHA